MLISHERLDQLKEQRDYLKKMHEYHLSTFEKEYRESSEFYGEENVSPAPAQLLVYWKQAGLVETTTRIELEIKFLEHTLID